MIQNSCDCFNKTKKKISGIMTNSSCTRLNRYCSSLLSTENDTGRASTLTWLDLSNVYHPTCEQGKHRWKLCCQFGFLYTERICENPPKNSGGATCELQIINWWLWSYFALSFLPEMVFLNIHFGWGCINTRSSKCHYRIGMISFQNQNTFIDDKTAASFSFFTKG